MRLTTHLHLVSSLRMRSPIHPVLLYTFMVYARTTLFFYVRLEVILLDEETDTNMVN